ncbi:MAG: hypothetical protein HYZ89_00045, partial [Candidatus Omnitrophica bacterium]|nr:hypothetical protein [Candidatus Omnitrophota bacterium]
MPTFQPFGPDHWTVLGVVAVAVGLMVVNTHRLCQMPRDGIARAGLAIVLLGNEVIELVAHALTQGPVRLPFQLCDLAMFMMAWALLGHNRFVAEVAFLW